MMDQTQAAKYFIVAWVKDWSLRMYLDTVAGKGFPHEKAHEAFKWLPKDVGLFIRNIKVRRYIADAFHQLNNKLWDAADNAQRLALAGLVSAASGEHAKQRLDRSRQESRKTAKQYKDAMLTSRMSVDAMRRGGGHHWAVCK